MTQTHPLLGWHAVHYGVKVFHEDGGSSLQDSPVGVRLAVQPAECSPPVILPDRPWEEGHLSHFRLVKEGGRYRLWYGGGEFLCYAESTDGYSWAKPSLNRVDYQGSVTNNIAFEQGWPCMCWFEDVDATAEVRFKAMGLEAAWIDQEGNEVPESVVRDAMTHRSGDEREPLGYHIRSGMSGYTSPNRYHWTKIDASLMDLFSDSQPVAWYDPEAQLYRGYFRTLWARKRAVGYAETRDFLDWPLPKVVFHASPQDGPDDDVYTSCYCPYPERSDLHLMFPAMYHHTPDTLDIHLAVSLDGLDWSRPEFKPIIPLGDFDGMPEQALYASPDLVTQPDGRWGLMYQSTLRPHNNDYFEAPRDHYAQCYRWALWKPHRLVGVVAGGEGQFTIPGMPVNGSQLRLNFKTETDGWVRVALTDREGGYPPTEVPIFAGHGFDECDVLTGDAVDQAVRWKGSTQLPVPAGQNIVIHIRLNKATVFSVAQQ